MPTKKECIACTKDILLLMLILIIMTSFSWAYALENNIPTLFHFWKSMVYGAGFPLILATIIWTLHKANERWGM